MGRFFFQVDAIDWIIFALLQAEGRLTVTELAQRIALSVAPCHRRLRELERTGAIPGDRAVIDPEAIGLGFEVLVQVTMDRAGTPPRSPSSSAPCLVFRRSGTCGTAVR